MRRSLKKGLLGIFVRGSEYGRGLAAGPAEAGFGEIPYVIGRKSGFRCVSPLRALPDGDDRSEERL